MHGDYPVLEKLSENAIKEKQKFERLVVPKETLLEMFAVCVHHSFSQLFTYWMTV
jgi:threonyl-tRNA synthetase